MQTQAAALKWLVLYSNLKYLCVCVCVSKYCKETTMNECDTQVERERCGYLSLYDTVR